MSKKEKAYKKIRDGITYGNLRPGERLIETRICEMFKVGRAPLREAFGMLQIEGYIDVVKNKGAVVRKVTVQEVEEIYESIAVLESYATEKATRYIQTVDEKRLRAIQNDLIRCLRAKDYRNWLEKNVLFHEYFPKICENLNLFNMINSLRKRVFRYRFINILVPDPFRDYINEHEEILKALFKKEAEEAGNAMRKHGFHVKEILTEFLKLNPEI